MGVSKKTCFHFQVQRVAEVQLRDGGSWPFLSGRGRDPGKLAQHRPSQAKDDEDQNLGFADHPGGL